MKRVAGLKIALMTMGMFLLAACGGPMVKVELQSNQGLNPDRGGESLPVVVRVYQLNDKGAFESATFNQLWKSDEGTLGKTMLTRSEVILNPNSKDKIELDRHEQAKYVGIVAIFRNPIDRKWKDLRELSTDFLTKNLSTSFDVSLVDNTLHISD
jgi:type VI secretion system protein VasD